MNTAEFNSKELVDTKDGAKRDNMTPRGPSSMTKNVEPMIVLHRLYFMSMDSE